MTCRLYLITPPQFELEAFASQLEAALSGGDVSCVQLRLKNVEGNDVEDDEIIKAAQVLMPIAQAADVAFLINDRPDIAAQVGADGVHIGQKDAQYKKARDLLGPDAIIGVTCHDSRHLAMEGAERGASYVAFGAMFPTTTKDVEHHADVELVSWWAGMFEVPCVAIGGITVDNCAAVIETGTDFIAVSSGVWQYSEGPKAAVSAFNKVIAERGAN